MSVSGFDVKGSTSCRKYDGWPEVHHAAHVLGDARHQVAGAVAATQLTLVVLVNLVFLVVFDVARCITMASGA
jgi:hypothetical protein